MYREKDDRNARVVPNGPVANSHGVPDRVVIPDERLRIYDLDQRTPPRGLHPHSGREAISMDAEHYLENDGMYKFPNKKVDVNAP